MLSLNDYKDFFIQLSRKRLDRNQFFLAGDALRIAGGFDVLEQVGSPDIHPSAFDDHLLPVIDLELIAAGHAIRNCH